MSEERKNRFMEEDEVDDSTEESSYNNSEYGSTDSSFESDKDNLIDFLQFPKEKRKITDFLEQAYLEREGESSERAMQRYLHEHQSELDGAQPFHKPGHIGPLMYEYLNMVGVENAFSSGLQHTKSSMTKTIKQKVDDITTLLRGVGGINRQIKPSFTRNVVVYLEQEDPANTHRERVIFSVNIADFEFYHPLDDQAASEYMDDGRSLRRWVWDEAVNNLSTIVSNTGLKPKYVKNDKESCHFVMRQYLVNRRQKSPDEYFDFDLKYISSDTLEQREKEFQDSISKSAKKIEKLEAKLLNRFMGEKARDALQQQISIMKKNHDYFIATNPNPAEMDTGVLFTINSNTMKDYSLTKDKMQVIMSKFILALSRIAVDRSMDQQMATNYTSKNIVENPKRRQEKSNKRAAKAPGRR